MTEFTLATIPSIPVTHFQLNITFGRITDLAPFILRWQEFVADPALPWEFSCTLTLLEGVVVFQGVYHGDGAPEGFDSLNLEAMLPIGVPGLSVTSQLVTTVTHELVYAVQDIFGLIPTHFYAKSLKFTPKTLMSPAAVQSLLEYIEGTDKGTPAWYVPPLLTTYLRNSALTRPRRFLVLSLAGGYTSTFPPTHSAYAHRDALFFLQTYLIDLLPLSERVNPQIKAFANGLNRLVRTLVPGVDNSAYPGYVDPELGEEGMRAYWGENLGYLMRVKREWDPRGLFMGFGPVQSVRAA